ncbi:hypothetical protein J1N35_044557 [Gossypium stocksii]|uniref:Uncharacterized protein n=1 Tax=Gossypium stocksii TaxID=47602 RepID=A0A9D3U9D2_9ROSI|nr:hypothetical protein J1N35_044557 [Gossypium stocksii]
MGPSPAANVRGGWSSKKLHFFGEIKEDAKLGFGIYFLAGLAWEEFTEEWKNLNKFFLADNLVETSATPIIGCETNVNEKVEVEEDNVNPNDASANT